MKKRKNTKYKIQNTKKEKEELHFNVEFSRA
jgi:hypothetical protein